MESPCVISSSHILRHPLVAGQYRAIAQLLINARLVEEGVPKTLEGEPISTYLRHVFFFALGEVGPLSSCVIFFSPEKVTHPTYPAYLCIPEEDWENEQLVREYLAQQTGSLTYGDHPDGAEEEFATLAKQGPSLLPAHIAQLREGALALSGATHS